jgi:hypothetical protein
MNNTNLIISILELLSFRKEDSYSYYRHLRGEGWRFCYIPHTKEWHLLHWDKALRKTDIELNSSTLYPYLKEKFTEDWNLVRNFLIEELQK